MDGNISTFMYILFLLHIPCEHKTILYHKYFVD